ncbi:MAG: RDD family protein [Lentimicrobiaceae bacterium]|nr:RDD family protein [Lentimicrobiaceae bacterium]
MKSFFFKRIIAAIIDAAQIMCFGYLLWIAILQFAYIEFFVVFLITWMLYYFGCYFFFNGYTLGKILLGLQLTSKSNKKITIKEVFLREVIGKWILILIIPTFLFSNTGDHYLFALIVAIYIIALLIFTSVFFIINKITWWECISSTKTIMQFSRKTIRLKASLCTTFLSILSIITIIYPFINSNIESRIKSKFYPQYPATKEVREYADFIQSHTQDPVDYVFQLFEKYDLVVLSERMHPEYTQYELISDIVSDSRFAEKIGNIYIELGSISFQDTVNTYLHTVYSDEDSLNKATAFLQRNSNSIWPLWNNTNLFDFFKHINKTNSNLPDSLKLNLYFTDMPVDWETMTAEKYTTHVRVNRDKIMAEHIIQRYRENEQINEKRKKGLIIMNFRHGYGINFNGDNTTAVLMDSLPNKVCNVMLNTISMKYVAIMTPIQHGKWDKAFAMAGNPNVGFDFPCSPFGNDHFDAFVKPLTPSHLKYKDVFTGFIFYKPLEDHYKKEGFPYMLYHFEDTLIRRAECFSASVVESWKNHINSPYRDEIITEILFYTVIYNLITKIGFSIFIIIIGITCWIVYAINRKK